MKKIKITPAIFTLLLTGLFFFNLQSVVHAQPIEQDNEMLKPTTTAYNSDMWPSVRVFPNPVQTGNINVELINQQKGTYQMRLISFTGQVVLAKTFVHAGGDAVQNFTLPVQLFKGFYQLEITEPNREKQFQKIMISPVN